MGTAWPGRPSTVARIAIGALAAALAIGGDAAALSGPTRSFEAHVLPGAGRYTHASGRVTVLLTVTPLAPDGHELQVSARLMGRRCEKHQPVSSGCLTLSGTISGYASLERQERPIADAPGRWHLEGAQGTVKPLGEVAVVGTLVGTGYIHRGRPSIWIGITNRYGTVSMGGWGPLVGGFELP
jgi:hypothetical protein